MTVQPEPHALADLSQAGAWARRLGEALDAIEAHLPADGAGAGLEAAIAALAEPVAAFGALAAMEGRA